MGEIFDLGYYNLEFCQHCSRNTSVICSGCFAEKDQEIAKLKEKIQELEESLQSINERNMEKDERDGL